MPRDLMPFLGQRVVVAIDRPLGSRHPRHPDIVYPVNYGFLPGTVSGDGMPIDAYLSGLNRPVAEAEGVVVAVVVRADDVEDKLVVAPAEGRYTAERIMAQVQFQEQFFQSSVVMAEGDPEEGGGVP
jgi:inorganic pyrophosphatase